MDLTDGVCMEWMQKVNGRKGSLPQVKVEKGSGKGNMFGCVIYFRMSAFGVWNLLQGDLWL